MDPDTLKSAGWLRLWDAARFVMMHFDRCMEVEKCGMTA